MIMDIKYVFALEVLVLLFAFMRNEKNGTLAVQGGEHYHFFALLNPQL